MQSLLRLLEISIPVMMVVPMLMTMPEPMLMTISDPMSMTMYVAKVADGEVVSCVDVSFLFECTSVILIESSN